jgi:hypothetical protein
MSAALQLCSIWAGSTPQPEWPDEHWSFLASAAADVAANPAIGPESKPNVSLAFYRKHTEKMLRRYLYASMQVGRTPSILGESLGRGWVSSRPVKTFEDAVIFVLDVENCLDKLGALERHLLCRIVLQEYTQMETASLLGMSARAVGYKFPLALDRLTEKLLENGLLILPQS